MNLFSPANPFDPAYQSALWHIATFLDRDDLCHLTCVTSFCDDSLNPSYNDSIDIRMSFSDKDAALDLNALSYLPVKRCDFTVSFS